MSVARYLPRFQQAYRIMETLAAREQWTRAEIEAFQLERLNRVWSHAVRHVPYYRRLGEAGNLPPRFESLAEFQQRVPVLDKSQICGS